MMKRKLVIGMLLILLILMNYVNVSAKKNYLDSIKIKPNIIIDVNSDYFWDKDRDGIFNYWDDCTDSDRDGYGDPEFEYNTCPDDNCPNNYNPEQCDNDMDGIGNICDACPLDENNDVDGDWLCGNVDNCPLIANEDQSDVDLDGVGDVCDNCPNDFNPDQEDSDRSGIGDICEVYVWNKTFGGDQADEALSAYATVDGGFIVAGNTWSYGEGLSDIWLIKLDERGNKEWDELFTAGRREDDMVSSIIQIDDGNYVITGETGTWPEGGLGDVLLYKIDDEGDILWKRRYGEVGNEYGASVIQTSDGGFIITGMADLGEGRNYDLFLIKTDSSGNKEWDRTYGGRDREEGKSIIQTGDGGYVIVGYQGEGVFSDLWLLKVDEAGNEQWEKTFGGDSSENGNSIYLASDGGYIITGFTSSVGESNPDLWLIKTDSEGNEEWSRVFGGNGHDYGHSVIQSLDGGYLVTGFTNSYGAGLGDLWLIKTNNEGEEEWNKTYGGADLDMGWSVVQAQDDGFFVAGTTYSYGNGVNDMWLIKTDSLGNAPAEPSN